MWQSASHNGNRSLATLGALAALMACFFASPVRADSPPTTPEELQARIKANQESRNCEGMIDLFYTQNTDRVRLNSFTQTIREYICGNFKRKIASIAFQHLDPAKVKQPRDFGGKRSQYTLPPEGVVLIDYGDGGTGETKWISFLYGMHDGKAYLLTTKDADNK